MKLTSIPSRTLHHLPLLLPLLLNFKVLRPFRFNLHLDFPQSRNLEAM